MSYGKGACTTAADVYSLAMVFWEIITARVPFDEPGVLSSAIHEKVVRGERPPIPADCPLEYAELMSKMWVGEAVLRPTAAEVREELILMKQRWSINQTLEQGSMLTSQGTMESSKGLFERGACCARRRDFKQEPDPQLQVQHEEVRSLLFRIFFADVVLLAVWQMWDERSRDEMHRSAGVFFGGGQSSDLTEHTISTFVA